MWCFVWLLWASDICRSRFTAWYSKSLAIPLGINGALVILIILLLMCCGLIRAAHCPTWFDYRLHFNAYFSAQFSKCKLYCNIILNWKFREKMKVVKLTIAKWIRFSFEQQNMNSVITRRATATTKFIKTGSSTYFDADEEVTRSKRNEYDCKINKWKVRSYPGSGNNVR